jgi:hypothetical protein
MTSSASRRHRHRGVEVVARIDEIEANHRMAEGDRLVMCPRLVTPTGQIRLR